MNLIDENITNLTSLWQIVGELSNTLYKENDYNYCVVRNSEWPNRLWFNKEINKKNLESAKEAVIKSPVELKIPLWDVSQESTQKLFLENGLEEALRQYGMVSRLKSTYKTKGIINLRKVENKRDALLWSELFQKVFNYVISPHLVLLSCEVVEYFIAAHNHQPVGTCVLFANTKEVIGFHSMGIIPEQRRRGFAEEIFKELLNQSVSQGYGYATLQASEMAKPMYEKFEFSTQFIMANYQLKK